MENWLDSIEYTNIKCGLNGKEPCSCSPHVNLYWKIDDICQANCNMCTFHSDKCLDTDIDKLLYIAKTLYDNNLLNSIHITGGEPSLRVSIIKEFMSGLRKYDEKTFVSLNTNGYDMEGLSDLVLNYGLDNIALSRHHYDDIKNQEIFKTDKVATIKDIQKFMAKCYYETFDSLHLNCVLMKDYIGNIDELISYLDFAIDMNVMEVGFINLMLLNQYCREQSVLFQNLNIESVLKRVKQYTKEQGACVCSNYLYTNDKSMIKVYNRHLCNIKSNSGIIVYEGRNLRQGFSGNIII